MPEPEVRSMSGPATINIIVTDITSPILYLEGSFSIVVRIWPQVQHLSAHDVVAEFRCDPDQVPNCLGPQTSCASCALLLALFQKTVQYRDPAEL